MIFVLVFEIQQLRCNIAICNFLFFPFVLFFHVFLFSLSLLELFLRHSRFFYTFSFTLFLDVFFFRVIFSFLISFSFFSFLSWKEITFTKPFISFSFFSLNRLFSFNFNSFSVCPLFLHLYCFHSSSSSPLSFYLSLIFFLSFLFSFTFVGCIASLILFVFILLHSYYEVRKRTNGDSGMRRVNLVGKTKWLVRKFLKL